MDRTKIDAFIKANVGIIALVGAVMGLIPILMILGSFWPAGFVGELFSLISVTKPYVSFEFSAFDFIGEFYFMHSLGYTWLPILFYTLMLMGYFSLKNEAPVSYRLIRFSFSVIFISHIFQLLLLIESIFTGHYFYGIGIYWLIELVFTLAWAYVAFTILRSNLKPVDEFTDPPSL